MNDKQAFKRVYDRLMEGPVLFRGTYDAKNGSEHYMHGISTVIEWIAQEISEETRVKYEATFSKNMKESEDNAKIKFLREVVKDNNRYRNFTILPHAHTLGSDPFAALRIGKATNTSVERWMNMRQKLTMWNAYQHEPNNVIPFPLAEVKEG